MFLHSDIVRGMMGNVDNASPGYATMGAMLKARSLFRRGENFIIGEGDWIFDTVSSKNIEIVYSTPGNPLGYIAWIPVYSPSNKNDVDVKTASGNNTEPASRIRIIDSAFAPHGFYPFWRFLISTAAWDFSYIEYQRTRGAKKATRVLNLNHLKDRFGHASL